MVINQMKRRTVLKPILYTLLGLAFSSLLTSYFESGVVRVVISILAVAVLIVYFYVDYKKTWNH